MRFSVLVSFGLVTNLAVASVCKPRSSSGSSIGSSATVTSSVSEALSTTTAVTDTVTTTSVELATSGTSTADGETTTEVTESRSASSELSVSTATETTTTAFSSIVETISTTEATVTASETATTAETTTTTETTTTYATTATTCPDPVPTFELKAIGSEVDGQFVTGDRQSYRVMGWIDASKPRLAFSIDADTNYVREVSGLYLSVNYGAVNTPSHLVLYPRDQIAAHPEIGLVTCQQTCDRRLTCSAPVRICVPNGFGTTCSSPASETYNQFYMYREQFNNGLPSLVLNSETYPPSIDPAKYEALEIEVVLVED